MGLMFTHRNPHDRITKVPPDVHKRQDVSRRLQIFSIRVYYSQVIRTPRPGSEPLLLEVLPMGTPQALLAADTDRTQDYVFESARLPEIRGASRQLDDLDRRAANLVRQRGGQVILSGGGRLLAIVPLDEAEALALEVEKEYVSETRVATTTVDWRPLPPGALEQGYPPDPADRLEP